MSRKTKRRLRSTFIRLTALALTLLSVFLSSAPIFANEIYPPAEGVTSGEVYMLKNYNSGKYLTLPGYFDVYPNEENGISRNNIYQSTPKINDEYARAVRITYLPDSGEYTLCPLIFENFYGGYVKFTPSRNVEFSVSLNESAKWTIEYIEDKGAYVIKNYAGQALATYGTGNGGLDFSSASSQGNVIVENYAGRDNQMWILEARTGDNKINPHIFKIDGSVTKKNLGTGAEWIFKLSDSDMTNNDVSITSLTISGSHNGIISYAVNGKYILVKMNADTVTPDNKWDNYVAIQIAVRYSSEIIGEGSTSWRTVVVQDSGTGSGDGCKTIAIHNPARMHTVTINEGSPANFIITFKSDIQNVEITSWGETHDKYVLDYATYFPMSESNYFAVDLKGNNFAIIKAMNVGYTTITATDPKVKDHNYKSVIEVQTVSSEGVINSSPNVINMIGSENTDPETPLRIHLEYSSSYLLKTGSQLVLDCEWLTAIRSGAYLAETGANYAIFTTVEQSGPDEAYVDNKQFYEDDVWLAAGTSPRYAKFLLDKDPKYYLPDGVYFLKNNYQRKDKKDYLTVFEDYSRMSNPENSVPDVVLGLYDTSYENMWKIEYIENKASFLITSMYHNTLALCIPEEEVNTEYSSARLLPYDKNNILDCQLWDITYFYKDGRSGYILRNSATSFQAGKLYLFGEIQSDDYENSIHEIVIDKYTTSSDHNFIWNFETPPLSDWIFLCTDCTDQGLTDCTHHKIGYWENSPKVYMVIDPNKETTSYYMRGILENCVNYYNELLGLDIEIVSTEVGGCIRIQVMNNTGYSPDNVMGVTTSDYNDEEVKYLYLGNTAIEVYRHYESVMYIYATQTEALFKSTLYHEMAHALGIYGHTLNSSQLMYVGGEDSDENIFSLTPQESAYLKLVYESYSNG